jgi:hypothetical protein
MDMLELMMQNVQQQKDPLMGFHGQRVPITKKEMQRRRPMK